MGDIVSRMVVSVERNSEDGLLEVRESDEDSSSTKGRKSALKLGLNGCHDTTIAAILTSLGAFKIESWPEYTSHIAVELFRNADTPERPVSRARKVDKISSAGATEYHSTVSGQFRQTFGLYSGRAIDEKRYVSKTSAIARQKIDTLPPSERSRLDGYYVRIRYNDKPVTVPGCKASGKHLEGDESFCTLEAFKTIVDKFTPLHWKHDCWSNLDGPTFPAKPEPAGY
jgi:acid phosphatase